MGKRLLYKNGRLYSVAQDGALREVHEGEDIVEDIERDIWQNIIRGGWDF
ncbi:hypothetical protein GF336_02675 [Candidatus Woesearchaeota archaeon]|nr:hypothetical protein [Candidatus Woesearchaeota archaeon]